MKYRFLKRKPQNYMPLMILLDSVHYILNLKNPQGEFACGFYMYSLLSLEMEIEIYFVSGLWHPHNLV